MRHCLIGFFLFLLMTTPAAAAKLIMIESQGCSWCELWDEEIGDVYPLTSEGKIAPLVRYDIDDFPSAKYSFEKDVYYTPTFIVVDDTSEIGRIVGYAGESFFWGILGQILNRMETQEETQDASAGAN